ncbi:MAG: hypothetical protein O6700_01070 [Gammaproteobacteria bacterium]|nr:hypothetical protein [Gammaproteobacteria bacterium]MCZ6498508.1 hypothetical protein [Gammaproteobacteria bacterium]
MPRKDFKLAIRHPLLANRSMTGGGRLCQTYRYLAIRRLPIDPMPGWRNW